MNIGLLLLLIVIGLGVWLGAELHEELNRVEDSLDILELTDEQKIREE